MKAAKAIRGQDQLQDYHLYYAVLGEFEARLQNLRPAAAYFEKARLTTRHPILNPSAPFCKNGLQDCPQWSKKCSRRRKKANGLALQISNQSRLRENEIRKSRNQEKKMTSHILFLIS